MGQKQVSKYERTEICILFENEKNTLYVNFFVFIKNKISEVIRKIKTNISVTFFMVLRLYHYLTFGQTSEDMASELFILVSEPKPLSCH